jgi:hypothetical protein
MIIYIIVVLDYVYLFHFNITLNTTGYLLINSVIITFDKI